MRSEMDPGHVVSHGEVEMQTPSDSHLFMHSEMDPGHVVSHGEVEMETPSDSHLFMHSEMNPGRVVSHGGLKCKHQATAICLCTVKCTQAM